MLENAKEEDIEDPENEEECELHRNSSFTWSFLIQKFQVNK